MADDRHETIGGTGRDDTLGGKGGGDTVSGGAGDDVLYGFGSVDRDARSGAIDAVRVAAGFEQPLFAASPPGRPNELFVVEKTGEIHILDPRTGAALPSPFLDIPAGELNTDGEGGLLGLAFHPNYANNGRFFVQMTNASGDNEVRAYRRSAADPDVADPASGRTLLTVPHPVNSNHNGGWIGFGPDGLLYVATGDGGGQGDTDNSAQNTFALTGKILRIDVNGDDFPADPGRNYAIPDENPFADGADGAPEVWAFGLRNPWRNAFDPATGELFIADVGWSEQEEVNVVPAGLPGGLNFGWHVKEGFVPAVTGTPGNPPPDDPSLVDPVVAYDHDATNGGSITGGTVYRGPGGLQGHYVFADFRTDVLRTVRVEDGEVVNFAIRNSQLFVDEGEFARIDSFAVDGRGRLYAISIDGNIFRIDISTAGADGADRLLGGAGNDRIFAGAGADSLRGGVGDDALAGGLGNDALKAGAGDDTLAGGAGADVLAGADGANRLKGGTGADRFVFTAAALDPARDAIGDFADGVDLVDLREIVGGRLDFIGEDDFSGEAAEVRVDVTAGRTLILADVDRDGAADLSVRLAGNHAIGADDLLL